MTDKAIGSILVICGCLFILAAIGLFMYNEREEKLAAAAAEEIIPKLEEVIYENASDENIEPEGEISGEPKDEIIIDGKTYIGLLSVPSLGLVLPVQREWSYPALKTSPCRYAGSAEEGGFVIAGHNYNCHFGRLNLLKAGDEILFSDASGKLYYYSVYETKTLKPSAAEEMKSENWDLTLFTCTYSGTSRTAVRCKAVDEQNNQ